jgi:hypothetical protein
LSPGDQAGSEPLKVQPIYLRALDFTKLRAVTTVVYDLVDFLLDRCKHSHIVCCCQLGGSLGELGKTRFVGRAG